MAVRLAGVSLPNNKRIEIALTYIYGIGRSRSLKILNDVGIDRNTKTQDIQEAEVNKLRQALEGKFLVEGDLRRDVMLNIKRLKEIGSYRGSRHAKSLPVRGQRTKTNSRTVRGNVRKTMGSGRKAASEKT